MAFEIFDLLDFGPGDHIENQSWNRRRDHGDIGSAKIHGHHRRRADHGEVDFIGEQRLNDRGAVLNK